MPYTLGYQPALDGLRAVAILAVIAFHAWFLDGGFLGVDVFFVLSGTLITLVLTREKAQTSNIQLLAFYKRRTFRLMPALLAMVIAVGVWMYVTDHPYGSGFFGKALIALLYVTNIFCAFFMKDTAQIDPLIHTWSLAAEEQFYLIWPVVLQRWQRPPQAQVRKRLILILLVGMLSVAVLRAIEWHTGHRQAAYLGPLERADGLMAGCIVGLVTSGPAPQRLLAINRRWVALSWMVLTCAFVLARVNHPFVYFGGFTLVNVAAASVVLHVLHSPPRILQSRLMVWIGKLSYSLYLYNWAIRMTVCPLWEWPWMMLFQVALTFVCGVTSYYAIERPIQRWRTRRRMADDS